MSKVRRFDRDRLYGEIEWFATRGIKVVFSVDSNFGMFKSDVDLTDAIVEAKKRHGEPTYFVYSNAKNVPDRTVEITKKVVQAGLETAHTLSIQHSSEAVLAATDRENISVEKQIRVVRALQDDGIPISVQLIQGLPVDTPELWRRTFADLMEWGIHDGYIVTNYHLLPNAPAADPAYIEQWGLRTVDRFIYDGYGERDATPVDPMTFARGDVVVEAGSFSRDDWVTMSVDSACIRGLHNSGITQLIARYLRATRGVGFESFYALLLDEVLPSSDATREAMGVLTACYRSFLTDPDSLAMLPLPGAPESAKEVEPHRWFMGVVCHDLERFFADLTDRLVERFGDPEGVLRDLCTYQKNVVVSPRYDAEAGKSWSNERDWVAYFENPATLIPGEAVAEPSFNPTGGFCTADLGWDDGTGTGRFDWRPVAVDQDEPATGVVGRVPSRQRAGVSKAWFIAMATNRLSAAKNLHRGIERARVLAAG